MFRTKSLCILALIWAPVWKRFVSKCLKVFTSGTDANVFVTLHGTTGDSGQRALKKSGVNLFERGQSDDFVVECTDLGVTEVVNVLRIAL